MQCIQCGADMINTSGGNYYCPKCGAGINDLVFRPHNCDIPMPQGFQQQGWICPVCGRGVAPWVDYCPCVSIREIVYNSETDVEAFSLNGTSSIVGGAIDLEVKI